MVAAARLRYRRGLTAVAAVLGFLLVLSGATAPGAGAAWINFVEESPVALVGGSGKPTDAGAFVPVTPARFLDTRDTSPVAPDASVSFQVAGRSGIPANAAAVVFNLTVTEPKSFGFVTAYGSGTARPNSSNVNFNTGQTIPNAVTVPVGSDGKVTLFNRSSGTTHLIADVSGYYLAGNPTVPGAFVPVSPARFLDTRDSGPVGPDAPVSFQVGGRSGIPANAAAVVFNLTVTEPKSFGFATAYGSGTPRPNSSNVNFNTGQTIPNAVTVPVGSDGKVTLFNRSSGATHLIADVSGYYLAGNPTVPGAFVPVTPARFLDTRESSPVGADTPVSFQVGGRSGIPTNAAAVVFNLTVTDPRSFGFATAYGSGTARPNSSNVNFNTGQTIPNAVTVPVGADGKVTLFNRSSGTTHLIADVAGYYLPGLPNSVAAWGDNAFGLLGKGTAPYFTTPQTVSGLTGVKQWSFYGSSRLAAHADGTVYMWGNSSMTRSTDAPKLVAGLSNVASVTAGEQTHYATLNDGTVRAWGFNYSGELGNGSTTESNTPVTVTGLTGVAQLVFSQATAYARLTNGTVKTWGNNNIGQLGNGTTASSSTATTVAGLTNVTSITVEGTTVFAVLSDGSVRAWGNNTSGQFGDGTTTSSSVPVSINGLSKVSSITAHQDSYYALTSDKTVLSWGRNYEGQLGDGTRTDRYLPAKISTLAAVTKVVATYGRAYAVLGDGTVRAWGDNIGGQLGNGTLYDSATPVQVTGLTGVKDLSASHDLTVALRSDNTAAAWGDNTVGSLGNGTTNHSTVPVPVSGLAGAAALAVEDWSSMALMADGTVRGWGNNYDGELGIPSTNSFGTAPGNIPSLTGVASVTTHGHTRYAVMNDGTVRAWGDNSEGLFGTGTTDNSSTPVVVPGLSGVTSIVSNGWAAYALISDGTVRAWGKNHLAQLGDGGYADQITPVPVSGLTDVESIHTTVATVYALKRNGTVWAWGLNYNGQLGNPTAGSFVRVPVQVSGLSGVTQVLIDDSRAFALLADGTVRAWGDNTSGELGIGSTTNANVPVHVPGLTGVKTLVNAGPNRHTQGSNTFALLNDGTVRAWGSSGLLGNGTDSGSNVPVQVSGLTSVSSVAVGGSVAYATLTNGTVRSWGQGHTGQLGSSSTSSSNIPVEVTGLSGVVSVTAGSRSAYALKTDGTVWSWGYNQYGQLGTGTSSNSSNVPTKMTGLTGVTKVMM